MAPRRSLLIPVLLAALHLSSAVAEPILHGRSEVLSSTPGLEAGHSNRCAVIHLEALCAASGMPQVAGAAARDLPIAKPVVVVTPLPDFQPAFLSLRFLPANGVRAPPLS